MARRPARIVTEKTGEPVTVDMLRGAPGSPGQPGRPGDPGKDATLLGTVATGTATSGAIPAGGEVTVTVELQPPLSSTSYVATVTLGGTSTLLGQVSYRGWAQKKTTSIDVRLRNSGILVPSSSITVDVVAVIRPS